MQDEDCHSVRVLDAAEEDAIARVADGMRRTLMEVLGEERGATLYTREWLEDRVRQHLDCRIARARVLLAEAAGAYTGHCIVRVDADEDGREIGLFSTTWVEPEWRRRGIAHSLLSAGEAWMLSEGMSIAVTYTAHDNLRLHRLYEAHGYAIAARTGEFVRLERAL